MSTVVPALAAVVRRPDLWAALVRTGWRLVPPGWWRRWPPLPRPDPGYLAFRLETAYGDASASPDPRDLVAYLEWCRRQARMS